VPPFVFLRPGTHHVGIRLGLGYFVGGKAEASLGFL